MPIGRLDRPNRRTKWKDQKQLEFYREWNWGNNKKIENGGILIDVTYLCGFFYINIGPHVPLPLMAKDLRPHGKTTYLPMRWVLCCFFI